jgi:hypothetical protein
VRKVAVGALLALCSSGPVLLPAYAASALLPALLPPLQSCLADDDATTRHMACRALSGFLARLGPGGLGAEAVHGLYGEALKRLDDSNDAVRIAGAAAVGAIPAAGGGSSGCSSTACAYTVEALLLHLDDPDAAVQAAAFEALLPWAVLCLPHAVAKAREARDKVRHTVYVDRLLSFLLAEPGGALAGGSGAVLCTGAGAQQLLQELSASHKRAAGAASAAASASGSAATASQTGASLGGAEDMALL